MQAEIIAVFGWIRDLIIPPRPTERVVQGLTVEELSTLGEMQRGTLPYHDARVRALVWEIKYYATSKAVRLGGSVVSDIILDNLQDSLGIPLLIPIPMHPKRRQERGHNQTEVLAQEALTHLHPEVEYAPTLLERIVHTLPQQGLPQHKRRSNVAGSMQTAYPDRIKNRICIVLDDVSTTGATFAEATRVLVQAGAREVLCVSLAQS